MKKEIKIKVTFTEGYQERYTKACLEVIRKRTSKEIITVAGGYKNDA